MARRPKRPDPVALSGQIDRVLTDLGHGPVADALRVRRHWDEAVGPEIAAHAEPAGLTGDLLEVRVTSSSWAHELQLRQSEILDGLSRALGSDAPRRIRFRVG